MRTWVILLAAAVLIGILVAVAPALDEQAADDHRICIAEADRIEQTQGAAAAREHREQCDRTYR